MLRARPWVMGAVLAGFATDVVLHLVGGVRVGMSVGFFGAVLPGAGWCVWLALGRRNSYEHTARVRESRHARLGSNLMNILQLRGQSTDASVMPLTREMAGLAVSSFARELRDEPIEQLARTDTLQREAKRAGWWLHGFVAVLALAFDITKTKVPRFLNPFGDHPPYSFTRLEVAEPATDGAAAQLCEIKAHAPVPMLSANLLDVGSPCGAAARGWRGDGEVSSGRRGRLPQMSSRRVQSVKAIGAAFFPCATSGLNLSYSNGRQKINAVILHAVSPCA